LTAAGPDIFRRFGAAREAQMPEMGLNRGNTGATSTRRPAAKI
jgi:hypothetical protein